MLQMRLVSERTDGESLTITPFPFFILSISSSFSQPLLCLYHKFAELLAVGFPLCRVHICRNRIELLIED
jgi:hypothetical protein